MLYVGVLCIRPGVFFILLYMLDLTNVKVISFNVNGLRGVAKRRGVFNLLKYHKANIILLQETHSAQEDERVWSNEWGSRIYFAHGTRYSSGVAIMFSKNFPVIIDTIKLDGDGRFMVAELSVCDYRFIIGNVYGPNEDRPEFFVNFFKVLESRHNDSLMLGGDFNTSINEDKDLYNNKGVNHVRKRVIICEYLDAKNMLDIWRIRHPETRHFTWRKPDAKNLVMSRLDYFFLSQDLAMRTNSVEIKTRYSSDHCRLLLNINLAELHRGKGYWKFNNLHLSDPVFVEVMNKVILTSLWRVKNVQEAPLDIQWEQLKQEIIQTAKDFAIAKSKARNQLIEKLEQRILFFDKKLLETSNEDEKCTILGKIKKTEQFLLDEHEERVRAARFRSKAQYYMYGEKCSKYFFNLERSRGNSKIISQLIREDGSVIKEQSKILQEERIFYQKLYGPTVTKEWNYMNKDGPSLSAAERDSFEQPISDGEVANSLMGMANNKTPGDDGLTVEFYKMFWIHLKNLLPNVIRYLIDNQSLHKTARSGIISLLAKKDRDLMYLKNWRPLTLLNVDYKIISRIISLRLKSKIKDLVSEDQTGFIEGRDISESLRTILDVIQIAKQKSLSMVLVSMDWEKCFDKISFSAIDHALHYFNFGPKFRSMVQTLLRNTHSRVMNNGHLSLPLSIQSGAKQGANASPLLFILVAEVLSIQIRANKNIKGIKLGDTERKIAQFADDMNLFLQFEEQTIMELEDTLNVFEGVTNFKVNYDKTSVYRIGSLARSDAIMYTKRPFLWTNGPIRILGITIDYLERDIQTQNLAYLMDKVKATCSLWCNRGLTLNGKVLVVNFLCASLFVYRLQVLRTLDTKYVVQFNDIVKHFLWDGRRPKLSFAKLCNHKEFGGLKLINLESKDKALKCQWVAKIKNSPNIAKLAEQFLPSIAHDIWLCNISLKDIKKHVSDSFWRDVLCQWATVYKVEIDNPTKIAAQVLWYNSSIRIQNECIFYQKAHQAGITFLYNIWNKIQNSFLDYPLLLEIYGNNVMTFLEYYGLISAIPADWVIQLKNTRNVIESFQLPFETYVGRMTAFTYEKLTSSKNLLLKLRNKWSQKLQVDLDYDMFLLCFNDINRLSPSVKIRNFQFRFMHRIIFTADILYKWGVVHSPVCAFCGMEQETIEHLFYFCPITTVFCRSLISWYGECALVGVDLDIETFFFCNHENFVLNVLFMLAKQYIFSCKCLDNTPNIELFKGKVMETISIDKYWALKNKEWSRFVKRWKNFIV